MEKKLEKRNFLRKFLNVNREWCANAQIHGFNFLSKAKFKVNICLWSTVIIMSIGFGTTAIIRIMLKYFDYKVVETIKIEYPNKILFPSITICNLYPFNKLRAQPYIDNILSRNNLSYVKNLSRIDIRPEKIANLIKSNIADDYRKYGSQNVTHLGFYLEELILSCKFNNVPCNVSKDFIWHYSYDFVNCYTFNNDRDKYISEDGSNKSLQLEIFIGIEEIQSEFILTSGLNVMIQSHNVEWILSSDGKRIAPGYDTSFELSMVNVTALDFPYSNCIKNVKSPSSYDSKFFKAVFKNLNHTFYSQKVCFEICLQDYIKNICDCLDPSLPNIYSYNKLAICKSLNLLECVDNAKISYFNEALSNTCDQCPNECDSINYNFVFSSESRFSSYYNKFIRNKFNLSKYFQSKSLLKTSNLSKSIVKLRIFYNELKVTYLNQEPLLTAKSLVSNVGGIAALFLGMTLLEIPKIIEFFIHNLILFFDFNRPQKINFI